MTTAAAPAHTYDVYVNGLRVLLSDRWADAARRLEALSNAAGTVILTIDRKDVNALTVESLHHDTVTQHGYREPTEAELADALAWSK